MKSKEMHFHMMGSANKAGEKSPYFYLVDISKIVLKRLKRNNESVGLKPGYRNILYHLARGDEGGTQQLLVRHTRLSAPTVSVTLSKMESEGLIRRETDKDDMRATRVYLTDLGHAYDMKIRQSISEVEQDILSSLTEEECEVLSGLLEKVRQNLLRKEADRLEKVD